MTSDRLSHICSTYFRGTNYLECKCIRTSRIFDCFIWLRSAEAVFDIEFRRSWLHIVICEEFYIKAHALHSLFSYFAWSIYIWNTRWWRTCLKCCTPKKDLRKMIFDRRHFSGSSERIEHNGTVELATMMHFETVFYIFSYTSKMID